MHIKKLALISVLSLVVLGCVVTAGCTSSQVNQVNQAANAISGIWFSNYTDNTGNHAKATLLIQSDGTGICYDVFDNSTVNQAGLTWKQISDDAYAVSYKNGESRTFTLNPAKDTMTSSSNAVIRKLSSLSDGPASVLGPWTNEKTKTVTIFNADGTGSIYMAGSVIGTFTWVSGGANSANVHYDTGGFAGRDAVWSYNPEKDVLFGDDGAFSVTRPSDSVDGVTIYK